MSKNSVKAPANKLTAKKAVNFVINNAIIFMMLITAIVVTFLEPNFASSSNVRNLINNTAVRFIIALGVSGCLISKGTDLSAGRQVGLAACIAATLLQRADYSAKVYPNLPEFNEWLVLLIVIAILAVFGLFNGIVIAFFKVPPFIATLGTQTIIYGACQIFTGSQPIGGLKESYTIISTGKLFGSDWLPYLGFFALFIGLLMWFLYNKTPHGKYMYAIGGNENAAEVSGINTNRTKIIIYVLASVLYAIAGFLLGGKAGGTSVNLGQGYELEAIAGATIGGVSTSGGIGRISGILIGVLVFELLKITMQFLSVNVSWTYIVQGIVIVLAVALDIRKYIAKK